MPRELEPLAQSVLVEAVRNARKHAQPTRVEVALRRQDGAWVMEVCNDGVGPHAHDLRDGPAARGARGAAGRRLVEFGEREPGTWRVRLAVPHERP